MIIWTALLFVLRTPHLLLLLAIIAIAAYWNSPGGGYCYDDVTLIQNCRAIESWSGLRSILSPQFGPNFADLHFRPIGTLTFFVDAIVFHKNPVFSRLINLMLHLGIGFLFFLLWNRLFGQKIIAFLSAAIFLCHPITTEVVNCPGFRRDLLSTLFVLISLWFLMEFLVSQILWKGFAAAALWLLGLLSKEPAFMLVILAPMLFLHAPMIREKLTPLTRPKALRITSVMAVFGVSFAIFLSLYLSFSYKASEPNFPQSDHLAASIQPSSEQAKSTTGSDITPSGWPGGKGPVLGFLNFCRTFLVYARLWVYPAHFSTGHLFEVSTSYADLRIWLAWLLFALFAAISLATYLLPLRQKKSACPVSNLTFAGIGGLWVCLCLAPVAQILPSAQLMAERYIYMAHGGMALIFAAGLIALRNVLVRNPGGATASSSTAFHAWNAIVAALLLACVLLTNHRNWDWRDDVTLNIRRYELYENAEGNLALGALYYGKRERAKAAAYFTEAIRLDPKLSDPYRNLGVLYMEIGKPEKAAPLLRKALELDPANERNQKAMEILKKRAL